MDVGWWGFIGVVVGGLITGIVSIGGQWLANRHESDLDGVKRADNLKIKLDDLQRQTLLDLQASIGEWIYNDTQRAVLLEDKLKGGSGRTGNPDYDRDVLNRSVDAGQRVRYLAERVKDPMVRDAVHAMRDINVGGATSVGDLKAQLDQLLDAQVAVQQRIGDYLRQYL